MLDRKLLVVEFSDKGSFQAKKEKTFHCKASSEDNGTGQYPVWMIQNPRKGDFKGLKSKKFLGEACPRTPIEAWAFFVRLGNRSVVSSQSVSSPRSAPAFILVILVLIHSNRKLKLRFVSRTNSAASTQIVEGTIWMDELAENSNQIEGGKGQSFVWGKTKWPRQQTRKAFLIS